MRRTLGFAIGTAAAFAVLATFHGTRIARVRHPSPSEADKNREIPAAGRAPDTHATRIDLLTLFSFTGHEAPTERIDLAGGGAYALVRGWGEPIALPDGRRGVPMADPVATLVYEAGPVPGDLDVYVTTASESVPHGRGTSPASISLEVNGVRARRARRPDPEQRRFFVPATRQRPGRNALTLRRPRESRQRRIQSLPVVTEIDLRPLGARAPSARQDADRLFIPTGASITFYARAPDEAALTFDAIPDSSLPRILLLVDGAEPRGLPLGHGPRHEVDLGVAAGVPIGLTFESEDGAAIRAPAIVGRTRAPTAPATAATAAGRPNVILYVIDTLRADRLGCYGYFHATSPNLDRVAREGIVFRHAIAQAPWTRPSTASILTGALPSVHGAVTLRDRLRPGIATLAERFRAVGYATAGFVTNFNVATPFGFDRGFDRYEYLPEAPETAGIYVQADALHAAVLSWLGARPPDRPFFLYLHATDVHAPYRPRPETLVRFFTGPSLTETRTDELLRLLDGASEHLTAEEVQTLSTLYDAEIADWDAAFGRLWSGLADRGFADDTVLVLIADHGEEFRDHGGFEHGYTLYDEQVHIPLVMRLPGGAGGGRTSDSFVRAIDVAPTLAALADLTGLDEGPGVPLLTPDGRLVTDTGYAISTTQFNRREVESIVIPPWKVIFPPPGGRRRPEVYDLETDPGEQRDLAAQHMVLVGYARQELAAAAAAGSTTPPPAAVAPLAPEALDRLRSLGYVVD